MNRKGKEISERVTSVLNSLNYDSDLYYGKKIAFKRIIALCGFYDLSSNIELIIGSEKICLMLPYICGRKCRYVTINICYNCVNLICVNFGVLKADIPMSYHNLIRVIETIESMTENEYQDESHWSKNVAAALRLLNSENILTL